MLGLAMSSTAAAQGLGGDPENESNDPTIHGQWAGPYQLREYMNPPGPGPDEWAEIVHVVSLPPPNDEYVLFWNRRNRGLGGSGLPITQDQVTWLWKASEPNTVIDVPIPGTSLGNLDTFCGAQTLLGDADGRVLSMGGTDMTAWLLGQTIGSVGVFEFDNADATTSPGPVWVQESPLLAGRYYGGCLREGDGTIVTYGSAGTHGAPGVAVQREEFVSSAWSMVDNVENIGFCAVDPYALTSGNYPDVHLLSTGNWLRADGGSSYLLDKQSCLGSTSPDERFVVLPSTENPRNFGNSVHILYLDGGVRREVVYSIAGNDQQGCGGTFYPTVLRMTDPANGATWDDSPPDLARERHTGNAILLLDGSILEIGGANFDPGSGLCVPVLKVERYRPPEVFASASTDWETMSPISDPRTYHSVATLRPDGSVIVAGGVGSNVPPGVWQSSWHSVEVYKPPYFFQPGRRPSIKEVSSDSWVYGQQNIEIDVLRMNESSGEFRVALLSPCAGTHGVDFNQRYIELNWTEFSSVGAGALIEVDAPLSASVAPPGWYMLTVVNKDGLPSVAHWVKVGV